MRQPDPPCVGDRVRGFRTLKNKMLPGCFGAMEALDASGFGPTRKTMGKRRRARELAIQVLFHLEFSPGDAEEVFGLICDNFDPPKAIRPFSLELVLGVSRNKEELDRMISRSSRNWRLGRMSRVDRNILRIGVYEILFMQDIPPKVSIDEAVELGKKFGTDESGAFINGILDHVFNALEEERTGKEAP